MSVRALSLRYWVFDIPPALFIAEWYLQKVLPGRRIFAFRPFDDFETVRAELEVADVAFFTANQIALLPDACVDAFVNISSLHEMRQPQIDNYIQQMARTARDVIYLKQWIEFNNLADDILVTRASYRFPATGASCTTQHWCRTVLRARGAARMIALASRACAASSLRTPRAQE